MPDRVYIKKASLQDAERLEALAKEIWTQHYAPMIGEDQVNYMLVNFQSARAIAQQILSGTLYYIAYDGNIPCGYSAITPDPNGLFLSKLYVKEDYRGCGIARMMMQSIRTFALESGMNRIWLTCNKNNTGSLCAYQQLGFTIVDEAVVDIGQGFIMDDYVLEMHPNSLSLPSRLKKAIARLFSIRKTT